MAVTEYNYIPKYTKLEVNNKPKDVITHSHWNGLFNSLSNQGDHTAKELGNILNHLTTVITDTGSELVDAIAEEHEYASAFEIHLSTNANPITADKTFAEIRQAIVDKREILLWVSDVQCLKPACKVFESSLSLTVFDYSFGDHVLRADLYECYSTNEWYINKNMKLADQDSIGELRNLTTYKSNLVAAINDKQDKLIPGENITIAADGKTISAIGGGGSAVELDTTLTQSGKAADAKAVGDVTIRQAELGEDGVASFKNAAGIVLFTVDFSNLTPAVYGDMVISAEAVGISEGGSGTFAVHLATAPTVNQPVYLAVSDNTRLSVSPSSLTFTPENYATPQTVTVTSAQDNDEDDDTITVTLTSRKVDAKQLMVSIVDDDKPVLVENGLEFYINLRNMADQNSADTQIVDSVGGVVCTTQNVAFDDTSGFVTNDGLTLPTNDTKIKYQYPIKNAKVPNGYTYEITTKGMATLHGAGTGVGGGYAHKWSIVLRSTWLLWQADIGRRDATDTALAEWGWDSWLKAQESSFYTDLDITQEHTYTHVAEVDGSSSVYVDGVLTWTHPADDTFDHYNLQGTITYKLPYSELDYSMEVAAVRIYERALTADEILQNAKWDISQRAVQTF